ncbi:MAG: monovalent cation/H(+) antiporter subunit G [Candidatus Saganbacteria bacterium]|nr:monovalent cation/H(+) antiporter subunit G [Candidatus Saganbacteria bacterium]
MNETIGIILMVIGMAFNIIGCVGLLRLPDAYNRLQAASKCVTLGTCSILLSVAFFFGLSSLGVKALLCMFFILLTSPAAAHAIARGAHIYGIKLWEKSVIDSYEEDKR